MNEKPKVLLIDDEPDILDVLTILLAHEGLIAEAAPNGEAALKMLKENSYDLVVCDYLMPKMDGIALLKKVREMKDYTPFIFFSGNADESHGLKMTGLGAYQLLPKSEVMKLTEVIQHTLKHHADLKLIDSGTNKESEDFLKILHSA